MIVQIVLTVFLFVVGNAEPATATFLIGNAFGWHEAFMDGLATVIADRFLGGELLLGKVSIVPMLVGKFILIALFKCKGSYVLI